MDVNEIVTEIVEGINTKLESLSDEERKDVISELYDRVQLIYEEEIN